MLTAIAAGVIGLALGTLVVCVAVVVMVSKAFR